MKTDHIKAIVFDLGGVLVELDGPPLLREWIGEDISLEENKRRWQSCESVEAFEKGRLTADNFIRNVIVDLQLKVSAEVFLQRFVRWPAGLYPGTTALLDNLRSRFTLGCFSNTSELHWPLIMQDMALADKFHFNFASFQIGYYKPDPAAFYYITREMGLNTEQILFLDDSTPNVKAARKVGMVSELVQGVDETVSRLRGLGLLDDSIGES